MMGASKRVKAAIDPVAELFDRYPVAITELARGLRKLVRSSVPDAREEFDGAARLVGYSYEPGYNGLICTIIPSKAGVKLGLVDGAQVADPNRLLKGAGKRHRYVALTKASDLERPGIRKSLHAAAARCKERCASPIKVL